MRPLLFAVYCLTGLLMLANPVDAQLKKNDRVIFLGDSITQQGGRADGYVTLVKSELQRSAKSLSVEVVNAGISGHKVPDLEKRLERDVLSKKPTKVIIYIGINDVWHSEKGRGTSKEEFDAGLQRIIKRIKDVGAEVTLCTPSVIGEKTDGSNKLDAMLDEYSAISRQVAKKTNSRLIDLRKRFLARLKKSNADQKTKGVYTTDGVHLNKAGNQLVAEFMLASLGVKKATADQFKPGRVVVYKKVGEVELKLNIFEPTSGAKRDRPAIVFFFGGGWVGGSPSQFFPHCDHLSQLGFVAMSAEYRIKNKHKTTPYECVKDGKSAIRWVRSHADELGIDPNKVVAGGGSAGGHVAAATATVPGLDEDGEDQSVSCRPNALVLFNPVYDNGPDGWGHAKVKDRYKEISPMHNIGKHTAPAIVFLGTKDKLIPVKTAETFRDKMKAIGIRSELKLYEGQGHGFFNLSKGDGSNYRQTLVEMDQFLASIGFIKPVH